MSKGAKLIAAERKRQIGAEGWTADHDDGHDGSEMALAAICYAAPERVYVVRKQNVGTLFTDPWPWPDDCDKRDEGGSYNTVPDPKRHSSKKRLDLLVKAGALIAAEIDRLLRAAAELAAGDERT